MKDYVKENSYDSKENQEKLCFGISFQKNEQKNYAYSLHYFVDYSEEGYQDLPLVNQDVYEPFRNGANLDAYKKWNENGFLLFKSNDVNINIYYLL